MDAATGKAVSRRGFLKAVGGVGAAAAFARLAQVPWPAQAGDHITETFVALVDTIFPASPGIAHKTAASQVGVHEFVIDAFDSFLAAVPTQTPGAPLSAAVAGVIDAHAQQVTPGKTFVDQSPSERLQTLAAIDTSPNGDVRFVSLALYGMAGLGFYSEWPVYGRKAAVNGADSIDRSGLVVWSELGYPGPRHGWPARAGYNPGEPIDPTKF